MDNRPERRAQLAEKTPTDLINYALDLEDRLAAIDEGLGRISAEMEEQNKLTAQFLAELPERFPVLFSPPPRESLSPIARLAAHLKNRSNR